MSRAKLAVVDIDGTLVPESARLRAQVEAVLPYFGPIAVQEFVYRFFAVNDAVAKHEPAQKNNLPYYFKRLAAEAGVVLSDAMVATVVAAWEGASVTPATTTAFPDARYFLETLKARGFTIVVASGGSRESRVALLEDTGLAPFVDGVLASNDTGFQKQEAGFWEMLETRFPSVLTASSVVMVGNQWNDDVIHPVRLGYTVFLVQYPGELEKVRFSAESVVSLESVKAAQAQVAMVGESLTALLSHPALQ